MTIQGEQVFSTPTGYFSISPSSEGYTLNYSADGEHFTAYSDATAANDNLLICGFPKNTYYKCVGNNSTLEINW